MGVKVNNPRKHHYLPSSYLRNFSSKDGDLYVYERNKLPRRSAPKSEAHIQDFYAYDGEDGKNFEFEAFFSGLESRVAPVLQGILDREQSKERRLLTTDEVQIMRQFVGLTFTRTPAGRNLDEKYAGPASKKLLTQAAHDPERFAAMCKDFPNEDVPEQELADLIEGIRLKILNGHFDQSEPKGYRLHAMVNTGLMIAEELHQYNYLIIIAPKHENFITGDAPIVTGREENNQIQLGTSFATPDNAVWFPIASKLCLLWRRGIEPGYGKLPPRGVRMVNRHIMRFAQRFVYAQSYSLQLAEVFTRVKQQVFLGQNAFIPTWEGKPIL